MSLRNLFSSSSSAADKSADGAAKRDPRKAHRFFEHAHTVADAHNYDYAIELYISGLRHDPANLKHHEALRDVALRRKVGGGKPAGFAQRFKSPGNTAVDRMLHVEFMWAKDPLNIKLMRDFMQRAVEAHEAEDALDLADVAHWAGKLALEFASRGGKTDKRALVQVRDLFAKIESFAEAVEACKMALRVSPNDDNLLMDLKNLEAERTMQEGGYTKASQSEEGGFRTVVRDMDKQTALDQEDRVVKRASDVDQIIERRRAEHEEDPDDLDKLGKLVEGLLNKDEDETENEAMALLKKAWEQTGQYRYKMRMGDVRMKQFNRHLRLLKQQAAKAGGADGAEQVKQQLHELNRKKLTFELEEFQERVKNYPTDLGMRYELGRRLFYADRLDEAISAFQQAKSDPKHRAVAHQYLGTAYIRKGWYEEAIDTLRAGIEGHSQSDDRLGMELRYLLMDALERQARQNNDPELAREAQKLASQIVQTKIDFRDIQERLEKVRGLVSELTAKAG